MAVLQNGSLRAEIDESARLVFLGDVRTGGKNLIGEPVPLYRLNLHTGTDLEDTVLPEAQRVYVSGEGETSVIRLCGCSTPCGDADIRLTMRVTLRGDSLYFDAELENGSGSTVSELYYPCVGAVRSLGGGRMDLLWPEQLGVRYTDIGAYLKGMTGRESLRTLCATYPGPLSMSCMVLTDDESCLSFRHEDPLLHVSSLRAVGTPSGCVALEEDKLCFVRPGERFVFPRTVLRLYRGSWREAMDEYAAYAATWRKQVRQQDWMRRMNGYFLVIGKQQYGTEMWPYADLPGLYDLACANGCDVLGLFGWYHTGHDNNYPDLDVSPGMGGREGLEAGIRRVHEKGGHVTLYYQGHLMDINSRWYREKGRELEGRTLYGNPYYEFYPKACRSDFARSFSKRVFSTVCPSCTQWHDLMAERLDWLASFGADGALYDQIGGMKPSPCFNEAHPHMNQNPALSYTQGRLRLLEKIRQQAEKHEGFAFMSEHFTDAYSQFLDGMHGIGSAPSPRRAADACGPRQFPQMFRYTFPESICTVRNPAPYIGKRMAAYAFAFGCRLEMELRYQTDREEILADTWPELREYAAQTAALRRKYEKYLLLGRFRAEDGIVNPHEDLYAERFEAEDGTSVLALWNDSGAPVQPELETAGRPLRWETADAEGTGMIPVLGPGGIAVVELG